MEIKQVNVLGQTYDIKDAFARALVANEYSTSSSYSEGDLCIYDDNLYKCLSGTTGSWNSNAWSQTTIVDNLEGGGSGYNFDITQDEWDTIVAINNQTISGTLSLSGVTKVADYMFESCSSLEEVDFPNCNSIEQAAFLSCTSLQSVSFPNCTTISVHAFRDCISLQEVNSSECTSIGMEAFYNCSSLQSIHFPNCTYIDYGAFINCYSLQSVYLLAPSVCKLSIAGGPFACTPMEDSSYLGYYGSIYVPTSLVNSYKTDTYWSYYTDRITAYQE